MKKQKIGIVLDEFKKGKLNNSSSKKAIIISEVSKYSEDNKPLPIRDSVFRTVNKYGYERFDELHDDLVIEILDVMLFATGTFNGIETNEQDIKEMIINANKLDRVPIVKITHMEENKKDMSVYLEDCPFAVGDVDVQSLKLINGYLVGNLRLFKRVVDLIYKGYLRNVSAEVIHNLRTQDGQIHTRVLDSIAILGAEREAQWEKLKIYNEHLYKKVNNYDKIEIYAYSEVFMEEEVVEQQIPVTDNQPVMEDMVEESEMENDDVDEISKMEEMKSAIISELKNYIGELISSMSNEYKEKNAENVEKVSVSEKNAEASKDLVIQKYKEDLDTLKSQVQKIAMEKEAMENSVFIDGLIKSCKIAPSLKEKASGLLNVSYKANYSENGVSFKDQIKDFLNSLETRVEYSEKELAPSDERVDVSGMYHGRTPEEYANEMLNTDKAMKYAEEKGISFEQAVNILFNS